MGKTKEKQTARPENKKTNPVLKALSIAGFPLFFIGIVLVITLNFETIFNFFKSQDSIKEWISSWGLLAPLVFICLQIIQVVIFIIPGEVTQLAGGYLFGMWSGTFLSVVGIVIGSAINFFLGRALGIPFIRAIVSGDRLDRLESLIATSKSQKITTITIFTLFLIPGFPKDAVTYVAGLTPMHFLMFLLISGLGRFPGILVSGIIGDAAAGKNWITVVVVSIVGAALFITGYLLRDKIFNLLKDKIPGLHGSEEARPPKKRASRKKR
jgi:uncharacterized membrane protein YdjX (TVP38/TMEM64 family)